LFVTHHIDEAVMLADRLLVFSPAPGRVLEIVSIPVPRPRDPSFRRDPRFVAIAGHVRDLLMHRAAA
jgi:NitT/TauT family transport system ATP-binding protein